MQRLSLLQAYHVFVLVTVFVLFFLITVLILIVVCSSPFVVGVAEEDTGVVEGVSPEEVRVEEMLVEVVLAEVVLVEVVLVEEVLVEEELVGEALDEEDVFMIEEAVAEVWEDGREEAGALD